MALVGGDFGNIQTVDPATGSLHLVTQAGFGPEFLDYFAVVEDVHSTCGRTARQGAPTSAPNRASRRTGRSPPLRDSARSSPRPWSTTPVT